ncbi:hypothetical protein [Kitasatospora sp. NPDC090091]|uniref:hypothetical protein n=1 Tax=Kitasatospora sp. NPDC090091 TaxID=3364081 RepID=UPI0037F20A5F
MTIHRNVAALLDAARAQAAATPAQPAPARDPEVGLVPCPACTDDAHAAVIDDLTHPDCAAALARQAEAAAHADQAHPAPATTRRPTTHEPAGVTSPATRPASRRSDSISIAFSAGPTIAYIHADPGTATLIDRTTIDDPRERALCRALLLRALRLLDDADDPAVARSKLFLSLTQGPRPEVDVPWEAGTP